MTNYTQNQPQYAAVQWVSGMTEGAFTSIVDPTNMMIWSVNADGSLHFQSPIGSGDIPLSTWIVSIPFWGTHTWVWGECLASPSGQVSFTDAEFTAQFTAA